MKKIHEKKMRVKRKGIPSVIKKSYASILKAMIRVVNIKKISGPEIEYKQAMGRIYIAMKGAMRNLQDSYKPAKKSIKN